MIHTELLTKRFGSIIAVDRLSLDVRDGEVFGFLGPNGAGKTTTVRMLAGLISTTSGSATVAGCDLADPAAALRLHAQIGILPENVGLYEGASAYENLEYFGQLHRMERGALRSNIARLLTAVELWEERGRPVETFSKGMKQKLALARALVHDPVLLFLDEPTANLDPEAARMVRETILTLRHEGRTVVLNTHNLDEAQRICDRVGILRSRLLTVGAPQELERELVGRRTLVRLERCTEEMAEAVRRRLGSAVVECSGNELSVEVADPDRANPEIVAALVAAGGRILNVTQPSASLEAVYLRLVDEAEPVA